jgi:tetratricopeptide (TPR) repeat protein
MVRTLARSLLVRLALGIWILTSGAEDEDPSSLNRQVKQLLGQGKYQQAIPIAKRAVELAKRTWDPEDPNTAETIDNLAVLYANIGEYAEAEPLYQEALRINQKV